MNLCFDSAKPGTRYENGLYTSVNLLDAEMAFQQARLNYIGALPD